MTFPELFEYFRTDPRFFTFGMVSAFVFGCCIASFLNVCIWRIPRGMSIVSPPSHCPKCDHKITPLENIPLLSWIFLGGKCSSCKLPISGRYFLVELTGGILFSLIFLTVVIRALPPAAILFYWTATAVLLCSAFTDCDLGIIPNEFTSFGLAMGLILSPLCPSYWQMSSRPAALLLCVGGVLIAGGLMAGCSLLGRWIFKREALGWGDVKLVAAVAALLGLPGALFTVVAGSLLGLVGFPVLRLALRKYRHRRTLKFAPFLALGGILWMLYANRLLDLVVR